MTTHCIPHPIPWHRSLAATLLDGALERAGAVARAVATHWAAYAEWRHNKQADRALAELSLHTLCDIGAGQARTHLLEDRLGQLRDRRREPGDEAI